MKRASRTGWRATWWCAGVGAALAFGGAACGDDVPDDACERLASVCGLCPADGDGPLAQESCNYTVSLGDAFSCQERLDDDTYGALGCR